MGYVDAEYDDIDFGDGLDYEGNSIPGVSEWQGDLSLVYDYPITGDLNLTARAAYHYIDEFENTDDNMQNQLITLSDWKLHLIDLTRAFRFSKGIPKKFKNKALPVSRRFEQGLQGLDRDRLLQTMGGVLSGVQVTALIARRDALLKKIEADVKARGADAVYQEESP